MLPSVSSATLVDVLRAAGFRIVFRGTGEMMLRRGTRTVIVPYGGDIDSDELEALLASADLSTSAFDALLDVLDELPPLSTPLVACGEAIAAPSSR